jgi:dTDP-4-dehydrorhamnose reductase
MGMKILVLGATGMAGHTVALYFKEKGYNVVSFSRTPFLFCENIIGDVFETEKFKSILIRENFDVVINCIGILNQDAVNYPTKAVFLNSYLPHFIVDILKNSKTKLIHMSTDCVFAGNSGPYFEASFCDGTTFYDRTKALGEVNDTKNLTFRNSIIGPDMQQHGIGLFNWFMQQRGPINGFTGAIWTGVTTLTLAKAMEKAIEQDLCGLYNLVNDQSISKYELLQLFNKEFCDSEVTINMQDKFQLDKSLKNTRNDFLFEVPPYDQMIKEMYDWIVKHKNLYPNYS